MKKLSTFCRYLQALNLKTCAHKHLSVLFTLIVFLTTLPSLVTAQSMLPSFVDSTAPGTVDYIVPNNIVDMYITVAGAQGGNTETSCYYQGGLGQAWKLHLYVGYCSPYSLLPGGIIRLITAGRGASVRVGSGAVGGAGGGGGSALLYKAPLSSEWIILAVAGGGGGAGFGNMADPNVCDGEDGSNGNFSTNGFNGDSITGLSGHTYYGGPGGLNGAGGSGSLLDSYGGGGAFSDGVTSGNQGCNGKKGLPDGGAQADCHDRCDSGISDADP